MTGSSLQRCVVCESPERPRVVRRLSPRLSVTRCRSCTVTALDPLPTQDELTRHYSDYYLTRGKSDARRRRLVEAHRPVLDYLVRRLGTGGPHGFLDFGCGSGEFLMCVAEAGHRAFGADLSSRAARDLAEVSRSLGLRIDAVDLSTSAFAEAPAATFDVITMFQVIEHVPHPLELARMLAARQCPGGLLYIECPNDNSALARAKTFAYVGERRRRMWRSLKYPEHLHGFSRPSIEALLDRAGYALLDCGDYAYGDGVHQVEAEFWWPSWRANPARWSPYGWSRSAIPVCDRVMSATARAGSGLYALGRKRA